MNINQHLAEKVMGWHKDRSDLGFNEFGNKESPWNYVDSDGLFACGISDFNPPENIEQAMMCLDTFESWCVEKVFTEYRVMINSHNVGEKSYGSGKAIDESLLMAISLACAKATGYSECEHEWVSADNEVASGCVICTKCKTIASAKDTGFKDD